LSLTLTVSSTGLLCRMMLTLYVPALKGPPVVTLFLGSIVTMSVMSSAKPISTSTPTRMTSFNFKTINLVPTTNYYPLKILVHNFIVLALFVVYTKKIRKGIFIWL
jgi:hypothetical protein